MDIQTYLNAQSIRENSSKASSAFKKLGTGFCEVSFGDIKIVPDKLLTSKLLKALSEYVEEKEKEFEKL